MPVTINSPGYWQDKMLDKLIADTSREPIPDPRSISSKLVPGQIDPRNADTIPGGAPMLPLNDSNKAQGDFDWITELLMHANKAGITWDANRRMKDY